jgi:hypothetical protein
MTGEAVYRVGLVDVDMALREAGTSPARATTATIDFRRAGESGGARGTRRSATQCVPAWPAAAGVACAFHS